MKTINLGLLGFGTIGAGVVEGVQKHGDLIARRTGIRLVMKKIADVDLTSDRGVKVSRSILTTDAKSVVLDPRIDVVIELIGGTRIARDLTLLALKAGKSVVTANKALLADHGQELFGLAERHHVDIGFEGSVGGCIPIIRCLREGLVADRFESICGIVNGTCNYILSRMEQERLPFDRALAEAQAKGYAEANPGLDIDGFDTAHKAVVLATLASGVAVSTEAVYVEGIRSIADVDIRYAADLGYRVKLLAWVKLDEATGKGKAAGGQRLELRVHPTLVPLGNLLASVNGVFNAILVKTAMAGTTMYYGRGAGRAPTASAVLADVVDVAKNLVAGCRGRVPGPAATGRSLSIKPMAQVETAAYVRIPVTSQSASAAIKACFRRHGVAVSSMEARGEEDGRRSVLVLTWPCVERRMGVALEAVRRLKVVAGEPVRIRIMTE